MVAETFQLILQFLLLSVVVGFVGLVVYAIWWDVCRLIEAWKKAGKDSE